MGNINTGVLDGVRRIGAKVRDLTIDGGVPGAPLGYRLRGATQSGPPAAGTWKAGDQVPDRNGSIWICTAGGTPGLWTSPLLKAKAYAQAGIILDMGYVGGTSNWLLSPAYSVPAAGTWVAGVLYLTRACVLPSQAVNGFASLVWVHNASMANSYIAVYNSAGTQLGVTADLSSQSTALIRVPCTGFTQTPADGIVYVAYVNGTSGVAGGPVFIPDHWNALTPTTANTPQSAYNNTWPGLAGNAGLTAPPASVTYSSYVSRGSLPSILLD
jgi:hypothetical protein